MLPRSEADDVRIERGEEAHRVCAWDGRKRVGVSGQRPCACAVDLDVGELVAESGQQSPAVRRSRAQPACELVVADGPYAAR